jgi:diguanylate cyclase (GGDEF)-like protein
LRRVRAIDKRKSDEAARSAVVQRELRIELARLTSQWAQQATQDPLTGLGNRRALERWMDERLPRVEHGEPLTLLLLDLDHFKRVNDRYGHGVGDEVLKRVARVIQQCCRHRDLAVRYGGEEFVLAMASVDHPAAVAIAHRVRESVAALPWAEVAAGLAVSVSIGLAEARETFDAPALLTLADKRLYAAKYAGRNQVVAFG